MTLIKQVEEACLTITSDQAKKRLLLAVSGGVDSMVMCHALWSLQRSCPIEIGVFHLDHMLREEAREDARLVKSWCHAHGLQVWSYRRPIEAMAKARGEGFEALGREVRYGLLTTLLKTQGFDYIVTAHHSGDQVESVLMHLLRGSGLQGLCGMSILDGPLFRPLLKCDKDQVYAYAKNNHIPYHEDHTNHDLAYQRNWIRNALIPFIEEGYQASVKENILRLSDTLAMDHDYLEGLTRLYGAQAVKREKTRWLIDLEVFNAYHIAIRRRLMRTLILEVNLTLKDLEKVHVDQMLSWLIHGRVGSYQWLGDTRFEKRQTSCVVLKKPETQRPSEALDLSDGITLAESYALAFAINQAPQWEDSQVFYLEGTYALPLTLRSWLPGDWIKLAGMQGHRKKIKKLFHEWHLSSDEKDKMRLLTHGHEVLWIVGKRRADHLSTENLWRNAIRIEVKTL